jgi:citrate lyase subunit beta/citryl-CoA lyase
MPIIESPLGILSALEIARAVPETAAMTLGLQDLTAELGVRPTPGGRESFFSRSMVVLAARAAGLQPIDTVYADVKNEEGLRESIHEAKELGFIGKGCIHPAQVAPINEGFLPDVETLEQAKKIMIAMEKAVREGLGAVALGSKMIDPAVARQAEAVIADAVEFGLIPPGWRDAEE